MNLAEQMKELATNCLYNDISILKESILEEIEHAARMFSVATDREFSSDIPLETRKELCRYLETEGFSASLLNNNQTISVRWG